MISTQPMAALKASMCLHDHDCDVETGPKDLLRVAETEPKDTRKLPEGYTCLHAGEDDISASSADMPAAAA